MAPDRLESIVRLLLICAVQFMLAAFVVALPGPGIANLPLLPVAVAVSVAQRQYRTACAAAAATALAAVVVWTGFALLAFMLRSSGAEQMALGPLAVTALQLLLWSAIGVPVGMLLRRRRSYGTIVALFVALAFALGASNLLVIWDTFRPQLEAYLSSQIAVLKAQDKLTVEQAAIWEQLKTNLPAWIWGSMFSGMLISACVSVTIMMHWLRLSRSTSRPLKGFMAMRPPDWLVWVVIAVAIAGIAAWRMDWPTLQMAAWNVGLGLFTVYLLNGIGLILYAATRLFGPSMLVYVTASLTMLIFSQPIVVFGLFDTWIEFRKKIDALVAAREARAKSKDDNV